MNIIEEFMKKYTEVLRQLAAGEIDNEEAFEQLMVMRDESAGISSRVRSAHLKELSSIIHAAVDHMCAEVAARCEHSIILQVAGQNIGAPSVPRVEEGQIVKCGELIANAPEKALGLPIHSPVDGKVLKISETMIIISAERT